MSLALLDYSDAGYCSVAFRIALHSSAKVYCIICVKVGYR